MDGKNCKIRGMNPEDAPGILEMMRIFYASEAVLSNGSEEIFLNDIRNCLNDDPYVQGYVAEDGGVLQGYAMIAKSYSTEFGKHCIWVEDLYVKESCRGAGIGTQMLDFIANRYPDCIFRLEVEPENARAIRVYARNGFTTLPYMEMKK